MRGAEVKKIVLHPFVCADWSGKKGEDEFPLRSLAAPCPGDEGRGEGGLIRQAVSRDGFRFSSLHRGLPVPALVPPDNRTSTRDPFLRRGPNGVYHLVATDGQRVGRSPSILYWSSKDLVHWSPMRRLPVMEALATDVIFTWAPEWVWDERNEEFMVFWATFFREGRGHFAPCDTKSGTAPTSRRHVFWHARTKVLFGPCESLPWAWVWKVASSAVHARWAAW